MKRLLGLVGLGYLALTLAYLWATGQLAAWQAGAPAQAKELRVGFLPVTCHLTCPVTDWIHQNTRGGSTFTPQRFNAWPELKEAFLAGDLPATFMIAPLAIKLVEQGAPLRIVYLGHRDGTALVVRKDSDIQRFADLRGRRVAVPSRFSNQYLLIARGLEQVGLGLEDVQLVELPPPDMPAALSAGAVDAVISGEPFMGQTELEGYGRVLVQAREIWPDFISCVLAVHQDLIDQDPDRVQELVNGIASSGRWLDEDMDNRMAASEVVASRYYHQDPALLRFVLSKPPDRVRYSRLELARAEFDEIVRLGQKVGVLERSLPFEAYADPRFSNAVRLSAVVGPEPAAGAP